MGWVPLILLVLLAWGVMYFFLIRPIRQREKQHDKMVIEIEKGDTVITAGGMYGQVDRIDEDSIILIVESGAKVRVTKGGILKREKEDDYTVR